MILKFLLIVAISFVSIGLLSHDELLGSEQMDRLQDSTKIYRVKARLIDTVKKNSIDLLCDHCAMALRFELKDSIQGSQYIDLVVFNPDLQQMKLDSVGGMFSITAFSRYKGPSVLIVPVVRYGKDVPLLWCEKITPNF